MPLDFTRQLQFEQRMLFRGFIGADKDGKAWGLKRWKPRTMQTLSIFSLERRKVSAIGLQNHRSYPKEMVLSPLLQKVHTLQDMAMQIICHMGVVYCFDTSKGLSEEVGSTVDRFVIGIDGEEALEQGYTPCYYCRV